MRRFLRNRSTSAKAGEVVLQGAAVYLRTPRKSDYEEWSSLRAESSAFLRPWEPTWLDDELTYAIYKARLKRFAQERLAGRIYPFFIFRSSDNALLGGITISQVRHGVSQSCAIGYWMGERYAGQGFMNSAMQETLAYIFNDLNLHRVEAACVPDNERSSRVLEKLGFTEEGYVREYLRINGQWQDHKLFAILERDFYAGAYSPGSAQ